MKRCVMAAVAVVLSGTGLSYANAADRTTDALLTCANESDDAQRLRCFDAVVANLRKAPAAPAATAAAPSPAAAPSRAAATPAPAAASPPPASAPTAEQRFGARGEISPDRHEEIDELTGTVTEVATKPHGELIVTLDNGQVWAEKQSGSKVKLKSGDTVKIERGAMGSYTLIANGRSSKVSRIR
jgi:translation initiation factor IF-1